MSPRPPTSVLVVAGLGLLVFFGASLALARPAQLIVRIVEVAPEGVENESWTDHLEHRSARTQPRSWRGEAPHCALPERVRVLGWALDDTTGRWSPGSSPWSIELTGPEFSWGSCGMDPGPEGRFAATRFEEGWGLECVLPWPSARSYELVPDSDWYRFDPPSVIARRGEVVTIRATRYAPDTPIRMKVTGGGDPIAPADWRFHPKPFLSGMTGDDPIAPDADGSLPLPFRGKNSLRGWIVAAGYRPFWTTDDAFRFDDSSLLGEADLERGFWSRLQVVDRDGASIGEGVEVRFGERTSTTQPHGMCAIESDAAEPERRIEVPGFAIVGGDVAADGTFPPGRAAYRVVVEPVHVMRPRR